MKITRRPPIEGPGGIEAPSTGHTGSAPAAPAPRGQGAAGASDRVEVSEGARLRQRLRGEVGDLDAISAERVRELSVAVAAERFHPAPRAIAERLLSELAADLLVTT